MYTCSASLSPPVYTYRLICTHTACLSRLICTHTAPLSRQICTHTTSNMHTYTCTHTAPLSRLMAREGTLGSNVKIDEKDYYAVRVRFPDLKNGKADFILDTAASNSVTTPQVVQCVV